MVSGRSAGMRHATARMSVACLLGGLAIAPFHADACRSDPPISSPPPGALAQASDLVAIVHVDHVRPLSPEAAAFAERIFTDPPLDVPIRLPTTSVEFTLVRALKGTLPVSSLIQNGITSCDVVLMEGRDYLIFARMPAGQDDEIVPLQGTFMVDQSRYSLGALAEVEHSLTSPNPTPP